MKWIFTLSIFFILTLSSGIAQTSPFSSIWIKVKDNGGPSDLMQMVFGNHPNATYGIDSLSPLIVEKDAPPPSPGFWAVWTNIPGRVNQWGHGLLYYDFRGIPDNPVKLDTFKLQFTNGDNPNADFRLRWPAWAYLNARCDSMFGVLQGSSDRINMFLVDSVYIPAAGSNEDSSLTIYKYGVKFPLEAMPVFASSPQDISFGEIPVDTVKMDSVLVTNSGDALLTIDNVYSTNYRFSIPSAGENITIGASKKFYISFRPTSMNAETGNIIFIHNGIHPRDTVTVHGVGILPAHPTILSIKDIPEDQGGFVRITWARSYFDSSGIPGQITHYYLWRKKTSLGEWGNIIHSRKSLLSDTLAIYYDSLNQIPAVQDAQYQIAAPTLADSTSSGTHRFLFLVSAHTSNPEIYWVADVDSGYSVDNLKPSSVSALSAIVQSGPKIELTWDADTLDPDIDGYDIYRSSLSGFLPNPTLKLGTARTNSFIDTIPLIETVNYYRVVTVDVHGNESAPSPEVKAAINITTSVDVMPNWNLLSLACRVSDIRKGTLYPTASSDAFIYQGAYYPVDTIKYGVGFWLKFAESQTIQTTGLTIQKETVDVAVGWNMIGSISTPITSIATIPPNIVCSDFFKFSGTYHPSDTLFPGRSYWVKATQAGKLIFDVSPSVAAELIKTMPNSELPPSPPEVDVVNPKDIPSTFALSQNFPNPFNPITTITYRLPVQSHVTLKVFDVLGREVATLVNEMESPGYKSVSFDAKSLPTGVYTYRLTAGEYNRVMKMIFIK